MSNKVKEEIFEWVWALCSFTLIWGIFVFTLINLGFSLKRAFELAIIFAFPTYYLGSICGYLREIIEQRKDFIDSLSKIADKLNETKEVDERLCDALEKQNERDRLSDARKALNS